MKLTKEQRRRRIRERYYTTTEKFFVAVMIALIFLALLAGIYYSIVLGWDPFISAVLIVAFLVMIPMSAVLLDTIFYEGI